MHANSSDVFGCGYRVLLFVNALAARLMRTVFKIVFCTTLSNYQPPWTVRGSQ